MSSKKFFWLDMEMTGLDEKIHKIIEVAAVVTDIDFKTLEEYEAIVFQPPEALALMDEWCVKTHGESGLTAKIPNGKKLVDVENELIALIDRHFSKDEKIVLCGNSIGNDKRFIEHEMKDFSKRLHYRLIDVSSFKEIFRTKYGIQFNKQNKHRAVDDIYESIEELKYYLKKME
jgi:oligoribonuclease